MSGRNVKCPTCGVTFVAQATLDWQTGDTKKTRPVPGDGVFPNLPAEFGRYRVLKLLGRGGMGAVYLAQDSQLGRRVALKIPFFDANQSQRLERFAREARSAAALEHPNICTVYDAGKIDGRPFITMAHISGTPLEQEIHSGEPIPQARAAEVVRKVALALDYAHRSGIVHRDLKPANVMIRADGEPVVMDFGLAKQLAGADPDASKLTADGGVLGTPTYMSPEQVNGDAGAIGAASDVYALGVVLFELLAGAPPYTGSLGSVMAQILASPVPVLREFRADADPRLDAICQRAMAKRPADRFGSMAEMAAALDECLKAPVSHPIPAVVNRSATVTHVPAPEVESDPFDELDETTTSTRASMTRPRPSKKANWKRPAAVAAALALLLPLVVWLAVVVLRVETPNGTLVVEIDDPAVEARIKGGKLILSGPDGKDRYTLAPGERDKKIDAGPYKVRVEGADGLVLDTPEFTLKKGDKVTVRVTVDPKAVVANKEPPKKEAPNLVQPAAGGIPAPSAALEALRRETIPAAALAYAGGGDPERAPAQLVGVLGEVSPIHARLVRSVAYSPDGRWLASGSIGLNSNILLREVATGRVLRELKGQAGFVTGLAFSKDSATLVAGAEDGTIRLWPVQGAGEPRVLNPKAGWVWALAGSPDGRYLAAGFGLKGEVKLWKWGEWDKPIDIPNPGPAPSTQLSFNGSRTGTLAFSVDGEQLAVFTNDEKEASPIRLYKTADGKQLRTLPGAGEKKALWDLAFTKDGKYLASVVCDTNAVVWDLATGKSVADFPSGQFASLAWHPDGKTLALATVGHVAVYDVPGKQLKQKLRAWGDFGLAFSPDGKELAVGVYSQWDTATWEEKHLDRGHRHAIRALAVVPDGTAVLTLGGDETLRRLEVGRPGPGKLIDRVRTGFWPATGVAVAPDGKSFAVLEHGDPWNALAPRLRVWDAAGLTARWEQRPTGFGPVYTPAGRSVAVLVEGATPKVWDAATGRVDHEFSVTTAEGRAVAVSAAGKRMAAVGADGAIKVWDVEAGTEVKAWKDAPAVAAAFRPDGGLLAVGHVDGAVTVWDPARGEKKRTLKGHSAEVSGLKFTPDGKTLISSAADGTIRLWSTDADRAREVISLGPPDQPLVIDLDRSGRYLFAGGACPAVFVLRLVGDPAPPGKENTAAPAPAADPDRKAAEYVLSLGGTVRVNNELLEIRKPSELPRAGFQLTGATLVGASVNEAGLTNFKGCQHLTVLDLDGAKLTEPGLANFKDCIKLRHLSLRAARLPDAGLVHFNRCTDLAILWLNGSDVGDAGVAHFKGCTKLVNLHVGDTRVTDTGVVYFKDSTSLIDFRLSGTQIGDAGIDPFKGCKELQQLSMEQTRVTATKIAELKNALPRCNLAHDVSLTEGFVPLFNGKDRAGWLGDSNTDTKAAVWNVKDGSITTEGTTAGALKYVGSDFLDYHLRLEVRPSEGGKTAAVIFDNYRSNLAGPNAPPGEVLRITGAFGGNWKPLKAPDVPVKVKPGQWYVHEIIMQGNKITILIDGQQVLSYTDPGRVLKAKAIYLWSEGELKVAIRKIEIKELPSAKKDPVAKKDPPADPFQTGSVWVGPTTQLTVTERKGETFRATLLASGNEREVRGTVKDGQISWLAKDVRVVKGQPGGDNQGSMTKDKDGDLINFKYQNAGTGTFVLRLKPGN